LDLAMSRSLLVAGCAVATIAVLLGGDVLAADRPLFCGTKPWQSIIREASDQFDLPRTWLDGVIEAESAGCATVNGKPITSAAGAMGLMQLMPSTWSQYRVRLGLGHDPFNAHDNIFAGAAYLHDLYRRFGEDGFLAAYQAGPERYEEFIRDGRPLPRATLDYIARVHRVAMRVDARSASVSSPVAPAASALFVELATRQSNLDRSSDPQLDTRLFVPLSRDRQPAMSSGQ
jgi:soluble lytic murein transglycosylase-like protein